VPPIGGTLREGSERPPTTEPHQQKRRPNMIAAKLKPHTKRRTKPACKPAPALSRAALLDRQADWQLVLGHHAAAERLARQAEAMRAEAGQ
jgi:hypothetical protein